MAAPSDDQPGIARQGVLGAIAEIKQIGSTVDCVIRNLSENGACVEFETSVNLPDQIKLDILCKKRCAIFNAASASCSARTAMAGKLPRQRTRV